jgi:hypothetical protein
MRYAGQGIGLDSRNVERETSRVELPVVAGIASATALVFVIRHFAIRRVAARQGGFVWLVFLSALLGGAVMLWALV